MKTIPLTLEEKDYERLRRYRERVSEAKSWEAFIMELINNGCNIGQKAKKGN